jgi:hypothetical protein
MDLVFIATLVDNEKAFGIKIDDFLVLIVKSKM